MAPEEALELGLSVLSKLGQLETNTSIKQPDVVVRAVVGAGFFDLNPAIVRLEILVEHSAKCKLRISAAAKEGLLFKQNTASQAVGRVVSELRLARVCGQLLGEAAVGEVIIASEED